MKSDSKKSEMSLDLKKLGKSQSKTKTDDEQEKPEANQERAEKSPFQKTKEEQQVLRNAEEVMKEVGEGSLESKEKTSTIDPPSSRRDIVKSAAKLGTRQQHLIAKVADSAML